LLTERGILALEALELGAFVRREAIAAAPVVAVGLANPIRNALGRRPEFAREVGRRSASPHQLYDPPSIFQRIWSSRLRHRRLLSPQGCQSPRNRGNFKRVIGWSIDVVTLAGRLLFRICQIDRVGPEVCRRRASESGLPTTVARVVEIDQSGLGRVTRIRQLPGWACQ